METSFSSDVRKIKHKLFFQNFVCDNFEQTLVPDDVSVLKQVGKKCGLTQSSNGGRNEALSIKVEEEDLQIKMIDVIGSNLSANQQLYLDSNFSLSSSIPQRLYELKNMKFSQSFFLQNFQVYDCNESCALVSKDGITLSAWNYADQSIISLSYSIQALQNEQATQGAQQLKRKSTATKLSENTVKSQNSVVKDNRYILAAKMSKKGFCIVVDNFGLIQIIQIVQQEKTKIVKQAKKQEQFQIILTKNQEIGQMALNNYFSKVVILIQNSGKSQELYCIEISKIKQITKLTRIDLNLEHKITSNMIFDEDGLFYFGTSKGEVHIYDQKLDPSDGAQALVIQGVQFGQVDQIEPFALGPNKKLAILQTSVQNRFEIVIFDRSQGTFQFECKCKVDQSWQTIKVMDSKMLVSFQATKQQNQGIYVEQVNKLICLEQLINDQIEDEIVSSEPLQGSIISYTLLKQKNTIIYLDSFGNLHEISIGKEQSNYGNKQLITQLMVQNLHQNFQMSSCEMEYNESTKQLCIAFRDQQSIHLINLDSSNIQKMLKITEEKLNIDCIKFSPDYTRLAIGLSPGANSVVDQSIFGQGTLIIYKVNHDGSSYDQINSIGTSGFDILPIPELHRITSFDWTSDCECIRITFGDFRKLHIVKTIDENGENEQYHIDNNCKYRKIVQQNNNKQARSTWKSDTCLLRWETTGIFRPDPCRVECVQKLVTKSREYALVGLNNNSNMESDTILRLFQWPCLSPLYPVSQEIELAPGYSIQKMNISEDGQKHIVCLVSAINQNQSSKLIIYKVISN